MDYRNYGMDTEALSGVDSDGDGYSNGDELEAGSFPGDPGSYPESAERGFNGLLALTLVGSLLLVAAVVYRMRRA